MNTRVLLSVLLAECVLAQFDLFIDEEDIILKDGDTILNDDYVILEYDEEVKNNDEEHTLKDDDDDRIVGGFITDIENHPHQVSIRYKGRHTCGGSIISEEWIITAAHCVNRPYASDFSIKAGSSTINGFGVVVDVSEIIVHEDYSSSDYDIAVLKLEEPLDYTTGIGPISLASATDSYSSGTKATVTGWGIVRSSGSLSNHLREVQVPLIPTSKCSELYGSELITYRMICAGYVGTGGKDACQGDSGGPLVLDGKLIGIVSWGYGCARPKYPGVYARVSEFRSWISENTGL